jgi:hypothetical protein
MLLDTTAIYSQTSGCEKSSMPDGVVVYQTATEKVHYLNPTAAIVYELCGAKQSPDAIAGYLHATFSLLEPPLDEVHACIKQLLAEGLIEPCRE